MYNGRIKWKDFQFLSGLVFLKFFFLKKKSLSFVFTLIQWGWSEQCILWACLAETVSLWQGTGREVWSLLEWLSPFPSLGRPQGECPVPCMACDHLSRYSPEHVFPQFLTQCLMPNCILPNALVCISWIWAVGLSLTNQAMMRLKTSGQQGVAR